MCIDARREQSHLTCSQVHCGLLMLLLIVVHAGCHSNDVKLVPVDGTVTLDGQPLPRAVVRFAPIVVGEEQARPSSGKTDDNGNFELGYTSTRKGARPGKYQVRITTFIPADPNVTEEVPELVPEIYNSKTILEVEVDSDHNHFDFDLKSHVESTISPRNS